MVRKPGVISGLRRSRRLAGLTPLKTGTPSNRVTKRHRRSSGKVGRPPSSSEGGLTLARGSSVDSGVDLPDRSGHEQMDCTSTGEGSIIRRTRGGYYGNRNADSEPSCQSSGTGSQSSGTGSQSSGTGSQSSGTGLRFHHCGSTSTGPTGNDESQPSCSREAEPQIRPDAVREEGPSRTRSASPTPPPSSSTQRRNLRELAGRRRQPAFGIMQTFSEHISGIPVQGESFCSCSKDLRSKDLQCSCGEEDQSFEWMWDRESKSPAAEVSANGREARFHVNYSSGTAAVRGSEPMTDGQYFWEIKMISPVYGTDMMVGVGTGNVDLDAFQYSFCSLLGRDGESWGLSYYGKTHNKGQFANFRNAKFGQGSILGLHLDMWQGTLSYYKNRQPLGVIFSGLRGKTLYPMISSTAARTGMKLVKACSYATSLEFLCCQVLRKMVPLHLDVTTALSLPPGLNDFFIVNNLLWLLRSNELSLPNMEASSSKRLRTNEDDETEKSEAGRGEIANRGKRLRRL